jgi:hypothetical protein
MLLAGVSLDERVDARFITGSPRRRVAGVRLNVDFNYDISVWRKEAKCTMEVSHSEGKQEWSQDVQMHDRSDLTDHQSGQRNYSEFTNRGVTVHFAAKGKIHTYRLEEVFSIFIQGLVLLPICGAIVGLLAKIGPRSAVYGPAMQTKLDYGRDLAEYGVMTAFVVSQMNAWSKTGSNKKDKISYKGFLAILCRGGFLNRETAQNIARHVFAVLKKSNPEKYTGIDITTIKLSADQLVTMMTRSEIPYEMIENHFVAAVNCYEKTPNKSTKFGSLQISKIRHRRTKAGSAANLFTTITPRTTILRGRDPYEQLETIDFGDSEQALSTGLKDEELGSCAQQQSAPGAHFSLESTHAHEPDIDERYGRSITA